MRRVFLPLLMVLALAHCATTGRPHAADAKEVKDLRILGSDQVSASDVEGKILTSATGWSPFATTEYFDPVAWQADLRRIVRYYEAEGYYHAQIASETVTPDGPKGVDLTVQVTEGPPTLISKIQRVGLDALPADLRDRVLDSFVLKPGERFQELPWANGKAAMQTALRELGYAEATVGGEAFVDLTTHTATLLLKVQTGARYKFGRTFVATAPGALVKPSRIIDQALPAVRPGSWFSETALSDAQARVFKMGVFAAVKVNRGAPDPKSGTVPVVIDVREAPFRTVRAGGGVGLDPTRQEVRTIAEYANRNFFGDLRRFTLRAKLGWAFLPSAFAVLRDDRTQVLRSEPIFTLTSEFEQPHLFFPTVTGQLSAELSKGVEQAFQYVGGRARAGVLWQPHPAFSVTPSYNFEADSLRGEALLGGAAPQLAFGCPEPCVISYLEQLIEWDRRNDRLEPTQGYYLSLSFQEGGGILGGSFDYLRIQPEARYYTTFGDRLTLAAQVRLGTLLPTSGDDSSSPIIARFFSGGDQMRGFGYHRLSPMLAVRTPNVVDPNNPFAAPLGALPGETVPVGGDGLFDGSVELRYALTDSLVLAVFLDTGFVTREHFQFGSAQYFTQNLQYALGIGLRYRTVVGPIRVDFARRLNLGPELVVGQLPGQGVTYSTDSGCFGLGNSGQHFAGAPDGLCNLQISIGEAF